MEQEGPGKFADVDSVAVVGLGLTVFWHRGHQFLEGMNLVTIIGSVPLSTVCLVTLLNLILLGTPAFISLTYLSSSCSYSSIYRQYTATIPSWSE